MDYGTFDQGVAAEERELSPAERMPVGAVRTMVHSSILLLILAITFLEGEILLPAVTGSVTAALFFIWAVSQRVQRKYFPLDRVTSINPLRRSKAARHHL
eukprot:TRINITY_DN12019_c0_g1_i1.p1 TRINITY_DN12019_c0_g1~~TRINITY_DN12019_c0_g1_i1.p1  ORF type:complete len:100 (+),score=17.05 TRINITY_DN12019_c0_g1_i1:148-447(+)